MEEYTLHQDWSYELASPREYEPLPEPQTVRANTR
jgi:hypothetical protein